MHECHGGDGFGDGAGEVDGVEGCFFAEVDVAVSVGFHPDDVGCVEDAGDEGGCLFDFHVGSYFEVEEGVGEEAGVGGVWVFSCG